MVLIQLKCYLQTFIRITHINCKGRHLGNRRIQNVIAKLEIFCCKYTRPQYWIIIIFFCHSRKRENLLVVFCLVFWFQNVCDPILEKSSFLEQKIKDVFYFNVNRAFYRPDKFFLGNWFLLFLFPPRFVHIFGLSLSQIQKT